VQVIDPEEPGSQCSFGNAGAISTGSIAPLAMPGILKSSAKMLLEADSLLYVPPHYLLRAAPWHWRFVASATPQRAEEIATALTEHFAGALEDHRALASEIGRRGNCICIRMPSLWKRTWERGGFENSTA
jgi:D-amino-acid dehydrogenase